MHNYHLGLRSLHFAWTIAFDNVPFKMCSLSILRLSRTRFPRACRAGATCFPSHSGPLIFTSFALHGMKGSCCCFPKKIQSVKYLTIISSHFQHIIFRWQIRGWRERISSLPWVGADWRGTNTTLILAS